MPRVDIESHRTHRWEKWNLGRWSCPDRRAIPSRTTCPTTSDRLEDVEECHRRERSAIVVDRRCSSDLEVEGEFHADDRCPCRDWTLRWDKSNCGEFPIWPMEQKHGESWCIRHHFHQIFFVKRWCRNEKHHIFDDGTDIILHVFENHQRNFTIASMKTIFIFINKIACKACFIELIIWDQWSSHQHKCYHLMKNSLNKSDFPPWNGHILWCFQKSLPVFSAFIRWKRFHFHSKNVLRMMRSLNALDEINVKFIKCKPWNFHRIHLTKIHSASNTSSDNHAIIISWKRCYFYQCHLMWVVHASDLFDENRAFLIVFTAL